MIPFYLKRIGEKPLYLPKRGEDQKDIENIVQQLLDILPPTSPPQAIPKIDDEHEPTLPPLPGIYYTFLNII